jgi:sugar phosphate permease
MLGFQAALMFAAIPVVGAETASAILLVLLATFIGFNYGTNLALFPALTKDFWGMKNFGMNYGILFTSWGVGGFVMGRLSQMVQAETGSFAMSFAVAGTLLTVAAGIALTLKDLKANHMELAQEAAKAEQAAARVVSAEPVLERAASQN